jgi:formyltetrahydrofolate deformylase
MSVARGREHVLTLSCPDKPGIVSAVSRFLAQHSGSIPASQQHRGKPGRAILHAGALLRIGTGCPAGPDLHLAPLERGFSWVAEASYMSWQLHDKAARVRSLIMAYWLGWPTCRPTDQESLRRM